MESQQSHPADHARNYICWCKSYCEPIRNIKRWWKLSFDGPYKGQHLFRICHTICQNDFLGSANPSIPRVRCPSYIGTIGTKTTATGLSTIPTITLFNQNRKYYNQNNKIFHFISHMALQAAPLISSIFYMLWTIKVWNGSLFWGTDYEGKIKKPFEYL